MTENNTRSITPLPIGQVLSVNFVQICEALNIAVLFPFLAFMVEDLGYTGEQLGYYAGALAASFSAAQFCSSVPWGMFSDKFGRKPAVVLGTFGAAVGMTIFGFSKTYAQAVIGRMISGILSGNVGVLKCFLTEITDDTNRGVGFSYLSLAWSIGTIIAPLAGGLLSNPADKYPGLFSSDGLFGEYPYLLPCLLCVASNVVAATSCAMLMKESRDFGKGLEEDGFGMEKVKTKISPSLGVSGDGGSEKGPTGKLIATAGRIFRNGYKRFKPGEKGINPGEEHIKVAYHPVFTITDEETKEYDEELGFEQNDLGSVDSDRSVSTADNNRKKLTINSPFRTKLYSEIFNSDQLLYRTKFNTSLNQLKTEFNPTPVPHIESLNPSSGEQMERNRKVIIDEANNDFFDLGDEEYCFEGFYLFLTAVYQVFSSIGRKVIGLNRDSTGYEMVSIHSGSGKNGSISGDNKGNEQNIKKPRSVLMQRVVVLVTLNYGFLCAATILQDETIPLFLKTDIAQGGFSFDSGQIGFLLAISGAAMLIFTLYFLPVIAQKSKFWMMDVGIKSNLPLTLSWPFLSLIYTYWIQQIPAGEPTQRGLMWVMLLFVTIAKNIMNCFCFTSVMILVNHSVTEENLGKVNGLGQSLGALARAIGPAIGGVLWSLSVKLDFIFFNFLAVIVLFLGCLTINRMLPRSLDYEKKKKKKTRV